MDDVKIVLEELKEESDSGVLGTAAGSGPKPGRRLTWALSVAAALLTVTVGVWLVRSKNEVPEVSLRGSTDQLSWHESWPSFSPDGTQVAFALGWREAGQLGYLRQANRHGAALSVDQ